ncbi:hypothetical protein [Prosthecomicrobium sp. N25]|uniref:hypothetical protein n=1 Tax=Prosthecomicrobium sp. N25 TaxID=3129254 RepID=UPI003076EA73
MVDLVNSPEDMKARRLEARRRRAEREGLTVADIPEDVDPAAIETPGTRQEAKPAEPVGNLVEIGNRKGRVKEGGANPRPDQDNSPDALPIPEIASSRLLARLGEVKAKKVAAGKADKGTRTRSAAFWSFVLMVILPAIGISAYLYLWAIDQYHSEFRFAVRNAQTSSASAGALAGMVASPAASLPDLADSYIVTEYLQSREFVEDLNKAVDLRSVYSIGRADYWYRMDNDVSVEKMTKYMNSMMAVTFDMYTGIVSVRVRAFSAEDARRVGQQILKMTEALVNNITQRARRDLVRDSEREVENAENRLRNARLAVEKYQSEIGAVDPTAVATANQVNINALEAEATRLKAELKQLLQTMSPQSPRVVVQQSRVDAIEKQITDEKAKVAVSKRAGPALSAQLMRYQELVTEREFAQTAYVTALSALERSRIDSERNQRYLALFVSPREAQDSEYPERGRYAFIAFLALFAIWAISFMVTGSIRDHMR